MEKYERPDAKYQRQIINGGPDVRGINVGSRLELEELNQVVSANHMTFEEIIDKKFPFENAVEAFQYLWEGKHVGKVVTQFD